MSTATETVDQVRSVPTAEAAAGRVKWLRSRLAVVTAEHTSTVEAAKAELVKAETAKADALKPLQDELAKLGVKLGGYFKLRPDVLPEGARDRFLKGGMWGEGTGLRLGSGQAMLDGKAEQALKDVWNREPKHFDDNELAWLAAGETLVPFFPHLKPLLKAAKADADNETDALTDLVGAVEDLMSLLRVKLEMDKKVAGALLTTQPGLSCPAFHLKKTAKLLVDGEELGSEFELGDD